MTGIPFSNFFTIAFMCILMLYIFAEMMMSLFLKDDNKEIKKDNDTEQMKSNSKAQDIIQIIMLSTIFAAVYLVFKYQFKPVIYLMVFLGTLMFVAILPYIIGSFLKYVFIKPFDYELTKDRENTLSLLAVIVFFVYGVIPREDVINQVTQFLFNVPPVASDFSIMALLTSWYFFETFFILSLFVLALQKINNVVRSKVRLKPKKENSNPKKEECKINWLSNRIATKIDALPEGKLIKKIYYYIVWFLCLPLDAVISFLRVLVKYALDTVYIIVLIPPKVVGNCMKYFSNILVENQGKTVIIISRISLVSSLLLVYLIDKYNQLFSLSGSEAYEFLCSVIIIPLFITQLIDIKNTQGKLINSQNNEIN